MSAVLKACFAYRSTAKFPSLFRRTVCVNANIKHISQFTNAEKRLRCAKWSIQVVCNRNVQNRCLSLTAFKLNATSNASNENGTGKSSTAMDASSTVSVDSTATTNVTSNEANLNTLTNTNATEIDLRDFIIPEPPSVPQYVEIPEHLLTSADLGLSWYFPTGWIFNTFQCLHQAVPWWGSIIIFTLVARILMFPVLIYSQKKTTAFANLTPKIKEYQQKLNEAKRSGNHHDFIKQANKMAILMEGNNLSPMKMMLNNLILPLSTATVFTCCFITLRTMTSYPIESMKTEGLFWFQDLTIMDPTFALQLLVGLSVFGVTKMGTEFGTQLMTNNWGPKLVQFGVPPLILIFTWAFSIPNAVLMYMITTNTFSMLQVWLVNQEAFRNKFKLPPRRIPSKKPQEPFTFKKSFESIKNQFTEIKEANVGNVDHRRQQKIIFEKAGIGPIQKTYKYDPTRITKKN